MFRSKRWRHLVVTVNPPAQDPVLVDDPPSQIESVRCGDGLEISVVIVI